MNSYTRQGYVKDDFVVSDSEDDSEDDFVVSDSEDDVVMSDDSEDEVAEETETEDDYDETRQWLLNWTDDDEQKSCRCGSTSHQRTNHRECPLNKRTVRAQELIDKLALLQQQLDHARTSIAQLAPVGAGVQL